MMNWIYTAVMNEPDSTVAAVSGAPAVDTRFRRLRLPPALAAIRDIWFAGTDSTYQRDAVASQLVALAYTPALSQYAEAVDSRLTYDPGIVRGHSAATLLSGDSSALRLYVTPGQGYGASRDIELVTSEESVAARFGNGVVNSRPLTWKANWSLPVPIVDAQLSIRFSLSAAVSGARFSLRHEGGVRLDLMRVWRELVGAEPSVQELLRPALPSDTVVAQLREIWRSDADVATSLGVLVCAYAVKAAAISRVL